MYLGSASQALKKDVHVYHLDRQGEIKFLIMCIDAKLSFLVVGIHMKVLSHDYSIVRGVDLHLSTTASSSHDDRFLE